MDPKLLTEAGWKAAAAKFKIKDNGLQKMLFLYENIDDEEFVDAMRGLNAVIKSANDLKKVKEVAGNKDVMKYLTDMVNGAQNELREVTKAKALAEKAKLAEAKADALEAKSEALQAKAEAEAAKRAATADNQDEEEDEEEEEDETGDSFAKLTTALKNLRLAKKPYYFLVCDAKPYGLMVSKKDIRKNAEARKELVKMAGGSTRPPKVGECRFENGKHVFEMEKPPSGLARILQKWIKDSTGLGLKIMVGTESSDDDGDGLADAAQAEAKPAVLPPLPALEKAPEAWSTVRRDISTNLDQLKSAIRKEFAAEGPKLVGEIEQNMKKLDGILGKLDDRLSAALEKARQAKDAASRQAELKNSKIILTDYIKYVSSEKLIAHIDANPFGVKTNLKQALTASLTQIAQAVG